MSSAPHQPTAPANPSSCPLPVRGSGVLADISGSESGLETHPRLIDPGHVARVRIAIVGTCGNPARYGGFETFAAQVSPLLVTEYGLEVTVIGDATCQSPDQMVAPVRSISP